MEGAATRISAPPFVSYSSFTVMRVGPDDWLDVYVWFQALKGHVQEYPGCQRFDVFVRAEQDGGVLVHCYTTWDTQAELEAFLEHGYTVERLLADLDLPVERTLLMEKLY
jgi:heme-degrading monooxygenase HmoA